MTSPPPLPAVEPALGLPQEAPYPSGTLNATLRGLNARSRYRLALRASTRVGSGPALQTVGSTKPEPGNGGGQRGGKWGGMGGNWGGKWGGMGGGWEVIGGSEGMGE